MSLGKVLFNLIFLMFLRIWLMIGGDDRDLNIVFLFFNMIKFFFFIDY